MLRLLAIYYIILYYIILYYIILYYIILYYIILYLTPNTKYLHLQSLCPLLVVQLCNPYNVLLINRLLLQ